MYIVASLMLDIMYGVYAKWFYHSPFFLTLSLPPKTHTYMCTHPYIYTLCTLVIHILCTHVFMNLIVSSSETLKLRYVATSSISVQ